MEFSSYLVGRHCAGDWLISPQVGEMGGSPEGGAVPPAFGFVVAADRGGRRSTLSPSALPGTSPTWGEIDSVNAFAITAETAGDIPAREVLLDRAMGPGRKRKSSEKLRRGRKPSEGLAFAARAADGRIVGTVRLWDVAAGSREVGGATVSALLLGPLAVDPSLKNAGIGAALMRHAIAEARRLGHRAILLVGDAPYYARFGFSAQKTGSLAMPGPYERHRLLALELEEGALEGAHGVITASGRKLDAAHPARPASRQAVR
jgi:predicted N-acetyltransferase YhbS